MDTRTGRFTAQPASWVIAVLPLVLALPSVAQPPPPGGGPPLFINEAQAENVGAVLSPEGEMKPWVEIFNPNDFDVPLANYWLTNDAAQPQMHKIPSGSGLSVPHHGFLLLWLDSDPEEGPDRLPFGLSPAGQTLMLLSPTVVRVDSVVTQPVQAGSSYGRFTDGHGLMVSFDNPTPGASNQATSVGVMEGARRDRAWVQDGMARLGYPSSGGVYDITGRLAVRFEDAEKVDIRFLGAGVFILRTGDGLSQRMFLPGQH